MELNNNRNLSYQDAISLIERNRQIIVLDVRSRQEYLEGHLKRAINIPLYDLAKKATSIMPIKNAQILAYCASGMRSEEAIKILRRLGYTNLLTIKGGINSRSYFF